MATTPCSSRLESDSGRFLEGSGTQFSATVGHDNWASLVINRVETGGSWKKDSETPGSRVKEIKKKFHSGRVLEIKNLPDGATQQDIRDAFPDLNIVNVLIEQNDSRCKAGAKITLEDPEILDEWPKSRSNAFVKNKEVSVVLGSSDGWLCVAKLPRHYTDAHFQHLASSYGKVKEAFLMISEKTGEYKGYGFIKYVNSDAAAQARHLLDGKDIDSYVIDCDWLNSGRISFKSLHSKCLYVDHLPPNYRDMGEFRVRFSVINNPPYCQIALRNGVIQNWGLVEFFDHEEAEKTRDSLNGSRIHDTPIRVHYCIPGVNAINIYMQIVNVPEKKKALLHDAPSASVYSQLQKLAKQNPNFAQNLQDIIQQQISNLSSGGLGTTNCNVNSESVSSTTVPASQTQQPTSILSANPNLNANAQAALMILLTAQMQSETGEVSLLQNPQVVGILQNLVSQAGTKESSSSPSSLTDLLSDPVLSSVVNNNDRLQKMFNKENRPSLLETSGIKRPTLLGDAPPGFQNPRKESSPTPPILANNLNNLLNTRNLSELLGSLNTHSPPINSGGGTFADHQPKRQNPRPVLLQDPPPEMFNRPPAVSTASLLPQPPLFPGQQFHPQLQMMSAPSFSTSIPLNCPPPTSAGYYINHPSFLAPPPPPQQQPPQQQPPAQQFISGIPIITTAITGAPSYIIGSPSPANNSSYFSSPNQLKRKVSIPPSPEQSPEGPYIGQHSQGLGGHYADSYWRNKRSRFH